MLTFLKYLNSSVLFVYVHNVSGNLIMLIGKATVVLVTLLVVILGSAAQDDDVVS